MKKIVTLGATTLTALTLLGAVQPLAHAAQIGGLVTTPTSTLIQEQRKTVPQKIEQAKTANRHVKAATDEVTIPDATLKTVLKSILTITGDVITQEDMEKLTAIPLGNLNGKKITSFEGMEFAVNLEDLRLNGADTTGCDYSVFNVCTKLKILSCAPTKGFNQTQFNELDFSKFPGLTGFWGGGDELYDLSALKDYTFVTAGNGNLSVNSQKVSENSQEATNGTVSVPIKAVKNADGTSDVTFTYQNNGKLENGNVVWDRLPSSTKQVTYTFAGKGRGVQQLTGTVTVPVTWASDEDKVQADVNLLFKDNTRTELNTGVTVQKIEDVRKEANALTDSAKKTELLGQIGDAYGMYFIVNAQAMKAGDPLGDKVKADANMKTLHDFMEAATDFEADMTKAKTSKAAAGTYDYVRSGWSKAVATAQACVNAYVPGTDLSQAGLGDFSTDVANLNTAANAIQGDQNDVTNDKVEVEYNYTAQAPGEPGWYGVVPSAVTLTDANRGTGEVANVELKNATQVGGHYMPYDGGKTVEVSVKSNNSYMLDDGKGDSPVAYKLNFVDGTGTHDVTQDASEHKIGEMKAGDTTIVSHIDLVGNATKSGRYVDNLFYHFSEK